MFEIGSYIATPITNVSQHTLIDAKITAYDPEADKYDIEVINPEIYNVFALALGVPANAIFERTYDEQERVATRIRYTPKATEVSEKEEDFWVPAIIKGKKKEYYTTPEGAEAERWVYNLKVTNAELYSCNPHAEDVPASFIRPCKQVTEKVLKKIYDFYSQGETDNMEFPEFKDCIIDLGLNSKNSERAFAELDVNQNNAIDFDNFRQLLPYFQRKPTGTN